MHGKAYVSLPHEGRIAVVGLEEAQVERYIEVGGQPTRMVLVHVGGEITESPLDAKKVETHGHHHH